MNVTRIRSVRFELKSFVSKDVSCVKCLNCKLAALVLSVRIECVDVVTLDDFKQGENPVEVGVLRHYQRNTW